MNEILKKAYEYKNELITLMSNLIRIKSFSTQEGKVIDFIKKEMKKNNFDEVFTDGIGNVIGRIGNGKTVIVMDAHIDTVEEGNLELWKKDPFSGEYDKEYVYGRGASDQKAGMCSMIIGAKILKELNLLDDFTLYITGTVMEEDCDGLCWKYIIENNIIKPDYVLITEPTNLNIYRGHRGRIEFRIKTKGLSAHASAPERGENAIYKMAKIINEIEKINNILPQNKFLGKGTIVVSQIYFKSPSHNAVPDECQIHIDRRIIPEDTKKSIFEEIKKIIKKSEIFDAEILEQLYSKKSYTGIEYSMEKFFPAWEINEKNFVLKVAKENYKKIFLKNPIVDKWTFSTNGTVTAGIYKIPTFGFGPGEERYAHAPNEKVKIEHLIKAAAFYASFPKELINYK